PSPYGEIEEVSMLARLTDVLSPTFHACQRWYRRRLHDMPSPYFGFKGHGLRLQCTILGTFGLIVALSWLTPACATGYYVDPVTGTNTNNGTSPRTPWQNPPGTRTANNSGFISSAWGAITTSAKVRCGDVILLKGGATQTSQKGGAWR